MSKAVLLRRIYEEVVFKRELKIKISSFCRYFDPFCSLIAQSSSFANNLLSKWIEKVESDQN